MVGAMGLATGGVAGVACVLMIVVSVFVLAFPGPMPV